MERSLAVLQRCVLLALGIHKHSFSAQKKKKKEISWYVKRINLSFSNVNNKKQTLVTDLLTRAWIP